MQSYKRAIFLRRNQIYCYTYTLKVITAEKYFLYLTITIAPDRSLF